MDWRFLGSFLLWLASAAIIGIAAGYCFRRRSEPARLDPAETARLTQQATQLALAEMANAIEALQNQVGIRSSEMMRVSQEISLLPVTGEMQLLQQQILDQVNSTLRANKTLALELEQLHERLERQALELVRTREEARLDAVSGVGNRKSFDEAIQIFHSQLQMDGGSFVLILLDLDRFKWINDNLGHQVGDQVLQLVGARLKQAVRQGDMVARYGGDEFAVLLPRADLATGKAVAARLHQLLGRSDYAVAMNTPEQTVAASVGLSTAQPADSIEAIIARADQALLHAKGAGRNCIVALAPGMAEPERVTT